MSRRTHKAALAGLVLLVLPAFGETAKAEPPPYAGLTLEEALTALERQGLPLVFTSRVVRPDMRVEREPEATDPLAVLDELLHPHGLTARAGTGGRLLVVRAADDPVKRRDGDDAESAPYVVHEEIEVTSRRFRIFGEDVSRLQLEPETLLSLPQLGDDSLRALKLLPGTSGDDLSARFSVRGGRPDEVMVVLDGLEITEAFHLKDYSDALSILAPETIGGVELLAGGFPAEYGDRMSGILNMTTLDPDAHTTRLGAGVLGAQLMDAGTYGENGSWLASLRGGTLELPFRVAKEEDNPRFWDVSAKLGGRLLGGSLRANVLASGDRLIFAEITDDGEVQEMFETRYDGSYLWLTHEHLWRGGLAASTRLSASRVERDRHGEQDLDTLERALSDERQLDVFGLAQDWSFESGPRHVLRWGFDLRRLEIIYDYENGRTFADDNLLARLVGPPRERTTSFALDRTGDQLGVYAADRLTAGAWTADLGLRFDDSSIVPGDHHLSPRVQLARSLGGRGRIFAAWGHYYQSQRLYELQVEDGETEFTRAERAEHRSLGFERTFGRKRPVLLRAEAYDRKIKDPRARWENLFEPISKVPEIEPDRVRVAPESSRSRGLELFLSGAVGSRVDWFASYTRSSVEDRIDGRDVPRRIDQTDALKLDLDVRVTRGLRLNLAARTHTGWPTTAILTDPELALGPLYGERLPDYLRFDLRLAQTFTWHHGELELYLDVQNVTNRKNVRGFDVVIEEGEDDVVRVMVEPNDWGPILPTFGLAFTWR